MLQALVLGRDLLPLAFARRKFFQIDDPLGDVGALGLALRELGARFGGNLLQPLPVAERLGRLTRKRFGGGVRVQELALRRGAQQRLVRVLAVQVDQPLARLLELSKGRGMAVDEAARAAGAVDRAPQDQLAGVASEVMLRQPIGEWASFGK